ncbi:hypothetical protein FF38_13614 [Lucilia cuprina]|uniref:Uncharacterized protein n=1 Tax=Lucilia cuprina TaxID=7375 RepID=A0A0L0CAA7_LUCCU|nr:hypothetical protein CVS40_12313 [Lucilia cuprina]KNC29160.1 hypothetical protein FF38_13614 [Lucilia cuprina]
MLLFQVIFAIGCIVIGVLGVPGHNIIKGDYNSGIKQSNSDVGLDIEIPLEVILA